MYLIATVPLCRDGIVVVKFTKSRKLPRHRFCILPCNPRYRVGAYYYFGYGNVAEASTHHRTPSLLQRKHVAQVHFYVQPGYGALKHAKMILRPQ